MNVKVNMVLISGVNTDHAAEVSRVARDAGAIMINPTPVVGCDDIGLPTPDRHELEAARAAAREILPTFELCKHCRADACGIPGGQDGLIWTAPEAQSASNLIRRT